MGDDGLPVSKSTVKATGTSAQENQFSTTKARKRLISKLSNVECANNKLQKLLLID